MSVSRLQNSSASVIGVLVMLTGLPAAAIEPVPDSAGWRGLLIAGAGYVDVRSNLLVGNRLIDVGRPVIDSIGQRPRSSDTIHPVLTGEVNYTFGNGWQTFLGTSLEDAVTLDAVTQFGARRNLAGAGTIQIGVLFSGIQTLAWEDPYAEGIPRHETDRDSTGARLQWDRILGSAFELTLSYRDIDFESERSGQGVASVDCNTSCQSQLRRDGDEYSFDLSYLFRLGNGRNHLLRPAVRYMVDDRDGDAVASSSYRLQLTYAYVRPTYTMTGNVLYGATRRDESNPLFGVRTNTDRLAVNATLFYRIPTATGRWQAVANVLWGEEDSDVSFHDSELSMVSLGVLYRFGSP